TLPLLIEVTDDIATDAASTTSTTTAPQQLRVVIPASTSPTVGSPVRFTATATGGTAPYTFSWNFGDGTILANGAQVMHTYSAKGTYTVTVTATDGNSATVSSSAPVTVAPKVLTASFTFSPTSPQAGQQVTFTATVSGGTTPYS